MNAGAAEVEGSTVLLCRVEDRRGLSHLTVARSRNGFSNWVVDEKPLIESDPSLEYEIWGVEDPRLTWIEELGVWVITFTSFGPGGPGLSMATTKDFRTVDRLGMVKAPEDKNGAVLPRRVGGDFIIFHRPVTALTHRADIWLSRSQDLQLWHPPEPVAGALYRAGLALLDLEEPTRVLRRCAEWVLGPREEYELVGDVPGVVFPCGLVHDRKTDELRLYYGAAD